jgi:hypothetical protein
MAIDQHKPSVREFPDDERISVPDFREQALEGCGLLLRSSPSQSAVSSVEQFHTQQRLHLPQSRIIRPMDAKTLGVLAQPSNPDVNQDFHFNS